jgi:hypothetical protein
MIGGYSAVIAAQQSTGPAKASWTTAVTAINPQALVTLPSNYLYLGKQLRVTAIMGVSNVVTAQNQFTFQIMMGSVVAWSSGAIACSTTAHTLLPAKLVVDLRVNTIGSGTSAHFIGSGPLTGIMWTSGAVADGSYGSCIMVPTATPAEGTGFDSTIANIMDFWVGCQTSNAGNAVTVYEYYVEDLN